MKIVLAGFGSPALAAAIAACVFYLYACVRRAHLAIAGLVIALLASCALGPKTVGLGSLATPSVIPLVLAGLVEVWLAVRTKRSQHALLALALLTGACATLLSCGWWRSVHGLIPLAVVHVGALLIGLFFRDRFARFIRTAATFAHVPMLALALARWSWLAEATWGVGPWVVAVVAVVVPFVYGWLVKAQLAFYVGLAGTGILGICGTWQFYEFLKATYGQDAVVPLFWSGASFLVALLISLIKIERIVRGVAGRVIALYKPDAPEDLATDAV